jgi:delta8-fatty-acid desaturase
LHSVPPALYPRLEVIMPGPKTEHHILTPEQVQELILKGHSIIILGQKVLKLDSWLRSHPGGDKAILHMVGRDATDEVNA